MWHDGYYPKVDKNIHLEMKVMNDYTNDYTKHDWLIVSLWTDHLVCKNSASSHIAVPCEKLEPFFPRLFCKYPFQKDHVSYQTV